MWPLTPKHVERPWGYFDEFITNAPSTVKLITVHPGESLSLQYHEHRNEFWVIVQGNGFVTLGDVRTEAKVGDRFEVGPQVRHRVEGGSESLVFLEISVGEFNEEDIVRLEDKYGRNAS